MADVCDGEGSGENEGGYQDETDDGKHSKLSDITPLRPVVLKYLVWGRREEDVTTYLCRNMYMYIQLCAVYSMMCAVC